MKPGIVHAVPNGMKRVQRTKATIDILEHAIQGIQTSENRGQIHRFHAESGMVGMTSEAQVRELDAPQVEREVIVNLPDRRRAAR